MLPVLHDCRDQLSWQERSDMASAVWMRVVETILSLLHNTPDWRIEDRQLCPCLLPAARHSTTWPPTHLKHGTQPYNWQQNGFCFWSSAEGATLLVLGPQGSISLPSQERHPRAELPHASEEGQCTNHAHQVSHRGPLPCHPRTGCMLATQHPCMGS